MSKTKTKFEEMEKPSLSTKEFDALLETGEDMSDHLDWSNAVKVGPSDSLNLTPTKVNVDFPKWMVESLDAEANRVGVPRQSLIKMWLADCLEGTSAKPRRQNASRARG